MRESINMNAIKEFFTEIFMWWVDWMAGGEAYDLVFRFFMTIFLVALVGVGAYIYLIK